MFMLRILKKLRLNEKQPISCSAHPYVEICYLDHLKGLKVHLRRNYFGAF